MAVLAEFEKVHIDLKHEAGRVDPPPPPRGFPKRVWTISWKQMLWNQISAETVAAVGQSNEHIHTLKIVCYSVKEINCCVHRRVQIPQPSPCPSVPEQNTESCKTLRGFSYRSTRGTYI